MVKNLSAKVRDERDAISIPGSGRCLGEGNGNPLLYSCLKNSMDRETWCCKELDITEHTHTHTHTTDLHIAVWQKPA